MRPDDRGSVEDGHDLGGQGFHHPLLGDGFTRNLSEEGFPRYSDHQGEVEILELSEPADDGDVVFHPFSESDPWVQDDFFSGNAPGQSEFDAFFETKRRRNETTKRPESAIG